MFVECDQVALPAELWARVQAGDMSAADDVLQMISGLTLYAHVLSLDGSPDDWALVALHELDEALEEARVVPHHLIVRLTVE